MKVHIVNKYHHKNEHSLRCSCEILGWELTNFEDADTVFSPNTYIDTDKFPDKKFVFGPHFSVFPNHESRMISNKHNNSVYIQPSDSVVALWKDEHNFTNIPIKTYAFGVDTEKFKPSSEPKTDVFIYFKRRDPNQLQFLQSFLNNNGISYRVFTYGSYNENEYIHTLNRSKYGIWVGSHESQGFAVQEALSMNVPLLVWNAKGLGDEYGSGSDYKNTKTPITTIPYWDSTCGEFFFDESQFSQTYEQFVNNLDKYKPRQFILDNLSIPVRTQALKDLVDNINSS